MPSPVSRIETQKPCAPGEGNGTCRAFRAEIEEDQDVALVFPVPDKQDLFPLVAQRSHALLVEKPHGPKLLTQPGELAEVRCERGGALRVFGGAVRNQRPERREQQSGSNQLLLLHHGFRSLLCSRRQRAANEEALPRESPRGPAVTP